MAFELQQLRQVVALAEYGSFVRAAAALHISQPALSRSVQNLERQFGNELFLRSSSGVVPTDLGRLYVERARDLLRMADELAGEAVGHARLRTGRVGIGGGPFPAESFLGPAVARFVEQFPRVSVHLHTGNWDDLLHLLRSRVLDFFVAETSVLSREPDLDVEPAQLSHPVYFVARAGHPLARSGNTVRASDIFAWPFATPSRIPPRILDPFLVAHRASTAREVMPRAFPAIECNGLAAVKQIVACSDTVSASILPGIAAELDSGQFVLLGTEPWLYLQYGVVSLRGRPWTQAAGMLRDLTLQAEREATQLEQRLFERHGAGGSSLRKTTTRSRRSSTRDAGSRPR